MKKKKNRRAKSLQLIPNDLTIQNETQHKIKLINSFCEHLKKGYSEKSFQDCDYMLIESFANDVDCINKNDFQKQKIKKAMQASLYYWETKAIDLMNGKAGKFSFQVWMYMMKCRFGWMPMKIEKEDTEETVVEVQLKLSDTWV
jgi:hypothetical protein